MDSRIARNRQFLRDLYAGPFRGHGIIVDAEPVPDPGAGKVPFMQRPIVEWVNQQIREYEAQLARLDALDHDDVPVVRNRCGSATEIFAAAFGCPIHEYADSNPIALPLVTTAAEADRLRVPSLDAPPLARLFEAAAMIRDRVGPDVPLGVCDIQSPFDIAALIWHKQHMYLAMLDTPEAVKTLVDKCATLLKSYLAEYRLAVGDCSSAHCPNTWGPPDLGCWLSEDEAGAMNAAMFEEFCVPVLADLSDTFGGLFVHCCATADHQYENFKKIPRLRGLNRVFQAPGPRPAIEAFAGVSVLMMAWFSIDQAFEMLDMALPDTRFLFNLPAQPLDDARATYDRLRDRCPRA